MWNELLCSSSCEFIQCYHPVSNTKNHLPTYRWQAGLAAYLLALPSEADRFKYDPEDPADNTVGIRIKTHMMGLAYQRLSDDNKLAAPTDDYYYDIPAVVNVAYKGAHGAQT